MTGSSRTFEGGNVSANIANRQIFVIDYKDSRSLHHLPQAWLSGARDWTDAQREAFANDLTRPQLVAVTDNLNESKGTHPSEHTSLCDRDAFVLQSDVLSFAGDKDIAQWQPPLASFRCTYARAWVQVKHFYSLTIDTAEKSALQTILDGC